MNPLKARNKIISTVMEKFNWSMELAIKWIEADNLNFKGRSPLDLIVEGNGEKVLFFLATVKKREGK